MSADESVATSLPEKLFSTPKENRIAAETNWVAFAAGKTMDQLFLEIVEEFRNSKLAMFLIFATREANNLAREMMRNPEFYTFCMGEKTIFEISEITNLLQIRDYGGPYTRLVKLAKSLAGYGLLHFRRLNNQYQTLEFCTTDISPTIFEAISQMRQNATIRRVKAEKEEETAIKNPYRCKIDYCHAKMKHRNPDQDPNYFLCTCGNDHEWLEDEEGNLVKILKG